jgi:hypothetical protein
MPLATEGRHGRIGDRPVGADTLGGIPSSRPADGPGRGSRGDDRHAGSRSRGRCEKQKKTEKQEDVRASAVRRARVGGHVPDDAAMLPQRNEPHLRVSRRPAGADLLRRARGDVRHDHGLLRRVRLLRRPVRLRRLSYTLSTPTLRRWCAWTTSPSSVRRRESSEEPSDYADAEDAGLRENTVPLLHKGAR